jgi:hypothetical protein
MVTYVSHDFGDVVNDFSNVINDFGDVVAIAQIVTTISAMS